MLYIGSILLLANLLLYRYLYQSGIFIQTNMSLNSYTYQCQEINESFFVINKFHSLLLKIQRHMRQNRRRQAVEIRDPEANIEQIYDPLSKDTREHLLKSKNIGPQLSSKTLFSDNQVQLHVLKQKQSNQTITKTPKIPGFDRLSKVLQNSKNPKKAILQKSENEAQKIDKQEFYNFNSLSKISYPQTPGFKSLLQSPFTKFNRIHKEVIEDLSKYKQSKMNFQSLSLNENPLLYFNSENKNFNGAKFFIGMSLTAKQQYYHHESLFFAKLACYADPCNQKVWKKYIALEQEKGDFQTACRLSKTAFLFLNTEQIAKLYLINGDKCDIPMMTLQGLLASLQNPQVFERTALPESAKIQLKHKDAWKGIRILYQLCCNNQFKLAVCSLILFLAKYLENIGYLDFALIILRRAFNRSMSKLEVYTLFLDMSIRKYQVLRQNDLEQVMKYSDYISGENRYKLFLDLAEYFYIKNDSRFYAYIQMAFEDAKKNCAPGAGCTKALKQIYFTVTKLKGIPPQVQCQNDHVIFEKNRYLYINGYELHDYDFNDWKYYLHYGLIKRDDLLLKASKKWPLTGRLIAQWIHVLRTTKPALQMLKLWRDKIDQVPKSGQLWCQGGRIYAELKQYSNASRCFREAIHFTPQYGDSFIEELRLLLRESQYLKIERLKKIFLISEPFYGQVLSFLKINHNKQRKLSMNEIWEKAVVEIKGEIYKNVESVSSQKLLTAYVPYNLAYIYSSTRDERSKLFSSYQQMENKN